MRKFYVDDELVEEEEFWSALETDVNDECESNFDEYLDEVEEEVHIFGTSFAASRVLYEMDYTMYNCMLCDYQSQMLDEKRDDLDKFGWVDINHSYYEIKEVDEEIVYIVHSDTNENNIYSEFEDEDEAIEYAKRNIDEKTWVDKVIKEDDEVVDEETIWTYTDEE